MTEFLFLSTLSFLFGITQKLADGHHEHGLDFFPGAGVVFGALFGGIGFYLIGYSPVLQAVYLGLLLYWFYKRKIDCLYHAIAAALMLLGVLFSWSSFAFPLSGTLGVFAGYVILDIIKHRHRWPWLKPFFAKRLHFHLVHLVYALYAWDVLAYSSLFFNLLGIAFANRTFAIPTAGNGKPAASNA